MGDGISQGHAHARGANTPGVPAHNTDIHSVLMILQALRDQQSDFGNRLGLALWVSKAGKARCLAAPGDQQSEHRARFAGLQGRSGLETNKVSLMIISNALVA